MSETKHTPVPWYITDDDPPQAPGCDAEGCAIVATVGRFTIYSKDSCAPCDKVDVKLIAAAPELLAACQKAIAWTDAIEEHEGDNPWRDMEAAIAKATGE